MMRLLSKLARLERVLDRHPRRLLWSVLIVAFALIITRRPDLVTHPQFWAEDGRFWYADAYNHGFKSLLYLYDGYLVFFYHLVALCSLLLPMRFGPLFFNLVAVLVQLSPLVLINSNRLRRVIPYRSLAIVISFIYVSIPNANEVFGNLTNIQWHLGVASFLVLIAETSRSRRWQIFDIGILLATGLSGPLVIMLFPIAALLWWRHHGRQNIRNLALLGALALLQLSTVFILSSFHRVGNQPGASLHFLIEMVVGQVFTGSLLGQKHVGLFYSHPVTLGFTLAIGLSLIIYAVIRGPLWLKLMNLFAALTFASMLVSLKPLPGVNLWMSLTSPGIGQRYWYIPMLSWLSTLLWLLLASRLKLLKFCAGLLLVLLIAIGIPYSWRLKSLPNLQFQKYVSKFQALPPGTNYSIPINPPGWTVPLHKK